MIFFLNKNSHIITLCRCAANCWLIFQNIAKILNIYIDLYWFICISLLLSLSHIIYIIYNYNTNKDLCIHCTWHKMISAIVKEFRRTAVWCTHIQTSKNRSTQNFISFLEAMGNYGLLYQSLYLLVKIYDVRRKISAIRTRNTVDTLSFNWHYDTDCFFSHPRHIFPLPFFPLLSQRHWMKITWRNRHYTTKERERKNGRKWMREERQREVYFDKKGRNEERAKFFHECRG